MEPKEILETCGPVAGLWLKYYYYYYYTTTASRPGLTLVVCLEHLALKF